MFIATTDEGKIFQRPKVLDNFTIDEDPSPPENIVNNDISSLKF